MIDALVGPGLLHERSSLNSVRGRRPPPGRLAKKVIELILFSRQMTFNPSLDRHSDATDVARLPNAYQMWTRTTQAPRLRLPTRVSLVHKLYAGSDRREG